jgi:hypothetical protein
MSKILSLLNIEARSSPATEAMFKSEPFYFWAEQFCKSFFGTTILFAASFPASHAAQGCATLNNGDSVDGTAQL